MIATNVRRPRNVDVPRAAAILYGDWGTSKAYVIGLAFAVAGYASFWLIAAMCFLTALVGINYIIICRLYPDGGGVYASVRHRSEVISIVGGFLFIADYLVTAAISALSAFQYLGVPHPEKFAAAAIVAIGLLNLLGPKHTGGLAFLIAVPTAIVVIMLGAFCLPHLGFALRQLEPLHGGVMHNWQAFVGIVLALSGVEAIANATGVMRLDPGSTESRPSVRKTSTPAILWVMVEVCLFTALFGLAAHALSGLQIVNGDVNAPNAAGVRDYMLRYMGQVFVGGALGPAFGHVFAIIVSVVFGLLLLSATNTAVVDLIAIQFLMARDREMPSIFQRLNRWGVPAYGMILAAVVPAVFVIAVKDMAGLADLYAVGVVGAIATNLGATSTDRHLDDQGTRAHPHVRHFHCDGGDRVFPPHRQTEGALFRRHDSGRRSDSTRARAGATDEIRPPCSGKIVSARHDLWRQWRSHALCRSRPRTHARFRPARSTRIGAPTLPSLRP